jgi:WD40 repeat protein
VKLWDALSGDLIASLIGHGGRVFSVAFSPNGKILATGSRDGTVRLWDPSTGKLANTLCPLQLVSALAFSPDGEKLAIGTNTFQSVEIWDLELQERTHEFHAHWANVTNLAFSPDGEVLASASNDGSVRLWRLSELPPTRSLPDVLNPQFSFPDQKAGWGVSLAVSPQGERYRQQSDHGPDKRRKEIGDCAFQRQPKHQALEASHPRDCLGNSVPIRKTSNADIFSGRR